MDFALRPLGAIATIAPGVPVVRGASEASVPVLHPRDLAAPDPTDLTQLERGAVTDSPRRSRAKVRAGDVLITARGTQFRSMVVPPAWEGAVATANLLLVRLGPDLLPEVLEAYLGSSAGSRAVQARSQSSAAGMFMITAHAIARLPVVVPPVPVQRELVRFARAAKATLAASERRLHLRREMISGVLEAVFAGEDIHSLSELGAI